MGELSRSSWGIIIPRSSWGFTTLHEAAIVLIAAAVLALVAFVVSRYAFRGLPRHYDGCGQRGLTLLETIIVLLIVAIVILAVFVLV